MDAGSLSRTISLAWLAVLVLRLVLSAVPYMSTPEGRAFMTAVNAVLIGGLVLIGVIFGSRLARRAAARIHKESHCQQCFARIEEGAGFCPSCGKKIRRGFPAPALAASGQCAVVTIRDIRRM